MKKIDWSKVPARTLVYVWDEDERPKIPDLQYFREFNDGSKHPFRTATFGDFKHADLVLPADIEKYSFEEKDVANEAESNTVLANVAISQVDFVYLMTQLDAIEILLRESNFKTSSRISLEKMILSLKSEFKKYNNYWNKGGLK